MTEFEQEHIGSVSVGTPEPISRDLLGKIVDEVFDGAIEDASVIEAIYAAIKKHETPPPQDQMQWPAAAKFAFGDRVRKHTGSWWEGVIVGFYSTNQTPIGYSVQMDLVDNGPVQIYPEAALAAAPKQTTASSNAWHTACSNILWPNSKTYKLFDKIKDLAEAIERGEVYPGSDPEEKS